MQKQFNINTVSSVSASSATEPTAHQLAAGSGERGCPIFDRFLSTFTANNAAQQTFLWEYIGAILSDTPGYKFDKSALLIWGPYENGKSRLFNLIAAILKSDHRKTAYLDFFDLQRSPKAHKLVNGSRLVGTGGSNLPDRRGDNKLLRLIRESRQQSTQQSTEPASKQPDSQLTSQPASKQSASKQPASKQAVCLDFNGLFLYATRDEPIPEKLGGHSSPFMVMKCIGEVAKDEQDSQIVDKMLQEKEAIKAKAAEAFKAVIDNGYKFHEPVEAA